MGKETIAELMALAGSAMRAAVLPEAEKLLAGVTPGPWYVEKQIGPGGTDYSVNTKAPVTVSTVCVVSEGFSPQSKEDAEFIAAAPTVVQGLILALKSCEIEKSMLLQTVTSYRERLWVLSPASFVARGQAEYLQGFDGEI